MALLAGLVEWAGWAVISAALLAGEAAAVWYFYWAETWVFHEGGRIGRRRWVAFLLLSQLLLFIVYLLLVALLQRNLPYLAADFLALLGVGFLFYLISEQWIWTRGLTMRQPVQHYYDIHGLLRIASPVALPDLAYFQTEQPTADSDLQLRVDRQGTPSRLAGGISYDEQLGRFGFGLTVLPGPYTEIIVSPLLETSPGFLYTNVVEPVLRWLLVWRGFALVRAAAIVHPADGVRPPEATLIHSSLEMADGLGRLCLAQGFAFAGDDVVILGRDGWLLPFPKPVTMEQKQSKRWLYSQPVRRLGLWFSARDLPVATLNTYLQRFIPQAKGMLDQLMPGVEVARPSRVGRVVMLAQGEGTAADLNTEEALSLLLQPRGGAFAFQPGPLLAEALSQWDGRDWREEEQGIVQAALAGCRWLRRWGTAEDWWQRLAEHAEERREKVNGQWLMVNG